MQSAQTRRRLLATLSCTMAASAFGGARISAQDAPPETTTIRLAKIPGICVAPQYIAEELLRIEGFSEVRYVDVPLDQVHRAVGSDNIDLSIGFIAQYIIELDLATPIVLLSGVHVGCFELFGTKRVNAIRDLKGKTVSVPALGSAHHSFIASMAAYVGVDAKREINFVAHPLGESARLLAEEKVDALALELIENPPVGALRDEACRARLDHARLAQPQGVKADRIIGIVVAPACVGNLLHRLKRIVVLIAHRRHQAGGLLGLGSAKVRCLGDGAHGTLRSHRMPADKLPVAGNDAAQVLRPGAIQAAADDHMADLLLPQLLWNRGEAHQLITRVVLLRCVSPWRNIDFTRLFSQLVPNLPISFQ